MKGIWVIPVIASIMIVGLAILPEVGIASCSGLDCSKLAKMHADRAERLLEDKSSFTFTSFNVCTGNVETVLFKFRDNPRVDLLSFPSGDQKGSIGLEGILFVHCADGRGRVIAGNAQTTICNTL